MKVTLILVLLGAVMTVGLAASQNLGEEGEIPHEIREVPQDGDNGIACTDALLWYNDTFCGGFTAAGCSTACNGHRTYTCAPTRCHCRIKKLNMSSQYFSLSQSLRRCLKYGQIFACLYSKWDAETNRVIPKKAGGQNLTRFSIFVHIFYSLSQIVAIVYNSSNLAETVEAVMLMEICLAGLAFRWEYTADPVAEQLLNYIINIPGNEVGIRRSSQMNFQAIFFGEHPNVANDANSNEETTRSKAGHYCHLCPTHSNLGGNLHLSHGNFHLLLDHSPPLQTSISVLPLLKSGRSSLTWPVRFIFAKVELVMSFWFLIPGLYYCMTILLFAISFLSVRLNAFKKMEEKLYATKILAYKKMQIENKLVSAAIRGRLLLVFAYLEPTTQILLALVVMMMYNSSDVHVFRVVAFFLAYIIVTMSCILIFTIAGKIRENSINWVKNYKARSSWERRVVRSLAPLRVEFGNNFVERLTPLVVQEFCIREVASTLILMR
ncbi:hypothetical protein Fcan01_00538 [Folsomia candida]|uniref:Uncharacterized protein n=1 Tax=Folsomia candida TaxID=158441 RepID=A0A226F516_FOLCA|nr:hypothetical protein Fcan01_00538 [Folsomia candida]